MNINSCNHPKKAYQKSSLAFYCQNQNQIYQVKQGIKAKKAQEEKIRKKKKKEINKKRWKY